MEKRNERFQIGKAYQHNSGIQMYITGIVDTIGYGITLIAENGWDREALKIAQDKWDNHEGEDKISTIRPGSEGWNNLRPVGIHDGAKDNWYEISVEEYINNNFSEK